MTFYRCPVLPLPGDNPIEVRDPLACKDFDAAGNRVGSECDQKFKSSGAGVKYKCPNLYKGCVMGAFLYPRKKRPEGGFHYHQGIDIGNRTGQPIVAIVGGEVVGVHKEDDNNGYGRSVVIKGRYRGKDLYTLYGHCHEIFVNLGERVAEQQKIATVGYSGNAGYLAPHLHFECANSKLPTKRGVETVLGQTDGPFPRTDPHRLLADLGPWGSTEVYFPDRVKVTEDNAKAKHAAIESSDRGGYFPLGANNTWHGGVHVARAAGDEIVAPFDAEIVALRLDPNPGTALGPYGHTNFILLRHEISDEAFRRLQWRPTAPGTPDDEADAAEAHAGKTFKGFIVGYPKEGPVTESAQLHVDWVRRRLYRIREYGLALGPAAPEIPVVAITGPYDNALRDAIIAFQVGHVPYFKAHGEAAEGYVTAKGDTRKRLAKTCAELFGNKKKKPKGTPAPTPEAPTVGHEGTNAPADVVKAKHALHDAVTPPGKFYDPADPAALDDPTVDDAFIAAIEAFQTSMGYPFKKKGLLWPDGVMTVEGKTWTALFAAQPPPPTPEPGDDPPPPEAPVPLDPKRTIYSLLMHLNAVPIDAAAAKRFPWLKEVQLSPTAAEEQDVAVQRALQQAGDDDERSRGIKADVGAPGVASDPDDVEWVRRRLVRFGYSTAPVTGVYDDELREAIAEFQRKHVKYYSPTAKKPQEAPGYVRVGVVSNSGKISKADTHKKLKESCASLFGETKPPVDPVFALRVATPSADGTGSTIITRPGVFVDAGQPLWASGLAQGRLGASGLVLYPQFHWELFSAYPMIEPWEQLEDPDDDLTVDVPGKVFDRIEYDGPPGFSRDKVLRPQEVLAFYASGKAAFFRQVQCRFRTEWGLDVATTVARLEDHGFDTTGYAEQMRPYLWWDTAKAGAGDAMPDDKHVWHYNPIEFLWRYEQVLATMRPKADPPPAVAGSVEVLVTYDDHTPASDVLVHLIQGMNVLGSISTDLEGVAVFAGVPPGKGVVWVDGTAVEAVFDLEQGQHRVVTLRTSFASPGVTSGTLVVTVLGTDAMPLGNASVRLSRYGVDVDAVRTDADGTASFVVAQGYYAVHAVGAESTDVSVIAGSVTNQLLQLVVVGMVAVEAQDTRGARLAGEAIVLTVVGGSTYARETTDADGHCLFERIPEGVYEACVESAPSVKKVVTVERDVIVPANLVVPLAAPNHTEFVGALDILVVGPDGSPSSGDVLYLLDDGGEQLDDVITDKHGRAAFEELEPGLYGITGPFVIRDELGIAVDAGARASTIVEVGNRVGTLMITAWFDGSTLEPLGGLLVNVARGNEVMHQRALDASGRATFEDVEAGAYRVFAHGRERQAVDVLLSAGLVMPVLLPVPTA